MGNRRVLGDYTCYVGKSGAMSRLRWPFWLEDLLVGVVYIAGVSLALLAGWILWA